MITGELAKVFITYHIPNARPEDFYRKKEQYYGSAGDHNNWHYLYNQRELVWSPDSFKQLLRAQILACMDIVAFGADSADNFGYSLIAHVLRKEALKASSLLRQIFVDRTGIELGEFMQAGRAMLVHRCVCEWGGEP